MNRLSVPLCTPKILDIWVLDRPLDNRLYIFSEFLVSLSFCDSEDNGRPSFFPAALKLAKDDFVR